MICQPCAAGADVHAGRRSLATIPRTVLDLLNTLPPAGGHPDQLAARLHEACTGCDCQHGGQIAVRVDPGDPTAQLDTLPPGHAVDDDLLPAPLAVHLDERTGLVIAVTHHDEPLPYTINSHAGPGPGSPDGWAVTRVDMIRT